MNSNKGENLIFLISQPRAGSTLTQRILGAHPNIHTQSEPWVMLHPLHAFKPQGLQSAYDSSLYATALKDFAGSLPGGEAEYKDAISATYNGFYNAILEKEGKNIFLDKTPRYYHIIPELSEYFPEAKFIFLWRNPASVIASILSSWVKKNWHTLSQYKDDLLMAPKAIANGIAELGNRAMVLKYEKLVSEPKETINSICRFLNIEYSETLLAFNKISQPNWKFGDENTVKNAKKPDNSKTDNWKVILQHPQSWRIIHEYIVWLNTETITKMGYSYQEISELILKNKPISDIESKTIPFNILLDNTRDIIQESRQLFFHLEGTKRKIKLQDEEILKKHSQIIELQQKIKAAEESITRLTHKLNASNNSD